jgi:nicotinamide-nucleotide amidase
VNVAGASSVFKEGFITYANEAKEKRLGVKRETLEKYGAVSEETVKEMAVGLAKETLADVTIVSSGIAGPDGGTKEKPVGLVYLCCFVNGKTYVEKNIFSGDRQSVRHQAVDRAIKLVIDSINK